MIQRRKDYSKKAPSKDASKIYIVCEGVGTEPDYFSFFEGLSSNLEIIVIPPEDGTDPLKLMELAKQKFLSDTREYTLDYLQQDKVWFAIDTDSWEDEGKITPLREFCRQKNDNITVEFDEVKPYEVWRVAQSNPCFEVWLYYHYYDAMPPEDDVTACASVKSYVHNCVAGGFDFQRDQVRLQTAIVNAKTNFRQKANGNPDWFSTEQYQLGEEILSFVKSEIQKLKNKLK